MCDRAKELVAYYSSPSIPIETLEILILSCESRMERYATSEAYVEDAFLLQCMSAALNAKKAVAGDALEIPDALIAEFLTEE